MYRSVLHDKHIIRPYNNTPEEVIWIKYYAGEKKLIFTSVKYYYVRI